MPEQPKSTFYKKEGKIYRVILAEEVTADELTSDLERVKKLTQPAEQPAPAPAPMPAAAPVEQTAPAPQPQAEVPQQQLDNNIPTKAEPMPVAQDPASQQPQAVNEQTQPAPVETEASPDEDIPTVMPA